MWIFMVEAELKCRRKTITQFPQFDYKMAKVGTTDFSLVKRQIMKFEFLDLLLYLFSK